MWSDKAGLVAAYDTRGSLMARVARDRGMVTLLYAAPTTPMMVFGFRLAFLLSASISLFACWRAWMGLKKTF